MFSKLKIGEITKSGGVRYGVVQPGKHCANGVPLLKAGDISNSKVNSKAGFCVSAEISENYRRSILKGGEVLISLVGNPGSVAIAPPEVIGYNVARAVGVIDVVDGVDARYFMYALQGRDAQNQIHALLNTTVQATLNLSDLKNISLPIPSDSEQKVIAHILGTLDDKIELNQKMHKTLEDIAKAIFKSWFVDFDPVRAKAEGRPTGLPDEISDLFPDTFEDSEIGEIPAGWKTSAVSGFADLNTKSINPSNSDEVFDHFSIPAFDNGRTPVADSGKNIKSNKTLMPAECLLVSKLNPDTPRIWYPNKAQGRRQICSTEFLAFAPRSSGKSPFLWGLFTSTLVSERMTAMVTGTSKSHQRVKPRDVLDITVTATPSALVEAFCKVVSPMLERTLLGKEETKTLSELRDTLLPKLISGELRIPDAEKFLEEAGV